MKSVLKKKNGIYIILISCLTFTGCGTPNTGEKEGRKTDTTVATPIFPDEVTLNLCTNVVESGEAARGIENAIRWIMNGNTAMNRFEMLIDRVSLWKLRDSTANAHTHTGCPGFITGLKTFVGLNGNDLTLLFTPILMCRESASSNIFTVSPAFNDIFVYENGSFKVAASHQCDDTTTYMNNVKFQETSGPRIFANAEDSTGDTKALMIPFQQIMAVLRQNESSASLKIWNFAGKVQAAPDSLIRQSILLGPDFLTFEMLKNLRDKKNDPSFVLFGPFSSNYADRSNLCPPKCSTIAFSIASPGHADCQQ